MIQDSHFRPYLANIYSYDLETLRKWCQWWSKSIQNAFTWFWIIQKVFWAKMMNLLMIQDSISTILFQDLLVCPWNFHDDFMMIYKGCVVYISSSGSTEVEILEARLKLQFSTSVEPTAQKIIIIIIVTPEISEMALRIFLKLCTLLDIKKVRKVTRPDFPKKSRFIHKVRKCGQNDGFSNFSRKRL